MRFIGWGKTMNQATTTAGIATLALLLGSQIASAFPTGSGADPAPAQNTVAIGDYCSSTYAPEQTVAQTADGQTVYCVQVKRTDAHVWWPVDEKLPVDPHFAVMPGDDCLGEGEQWIDQQGRPIHCNKTQNGRLAGNLVWQLRH
ncbi:hypothetical protein [Nocardia aurantiaca]|uniref:Uncharacterized protein n=1 Tax=Nocardia aurantiaca TaxID=2675850 RepID=A0A6I3L8R0_9NOCA|nr:hypothetical protein [Nocardia aurantiaca]MTE17460.1 hypothetical protein [Nocardia aurantiaca]